MNIHFGLARGIEHPRIRKVERIGPRWFVHHMRITSVEELENEVLEWLRQSYHQMGMQEHLERR